MVSLLHEGVIKLVRDCPSFAADLLGQVLHIDVPGFREARLADATLTELVPVEYRADAVVVFAKDKPVLERSSRRSCNATTTSCSPGRCTRSGHASATGVRSS